MCGVARMFSALLNGWSEGKGSTSKTSTAAPAICCFATASSRAFSFTIGPLEVLINRAVFFIKANSLVSIKFLERSLKTDGRGAARLP